MTAYVSAEHIPMIQPGLSAATSSEAVDALEMTSRSTNYATPKVFKESTPPVGVLESIKFMLTESKLNLLLIAAPFGFIAHSESLGDGIVFLLCLLSLIPLAAGLGFLTEELAKYTNPTLGGLMNATFGNATEAIISIFALRKGMLRIVQVSLLGSILSNMLLVLGSAFLLGGLRHQEQSFNKNMVNTNAACLMLGITAMLFPAVLNISGDDTPSAELGLSRFTSVFLLFVYGGYVFFQLRTHRHMFEEEAGEEDDDEQPVITFPAAVLWLTIYTILIAVLSEFLVDAIEGTATAWHVPQIFIGVILIPIVGNAAEHATAITAARKNKMELSLGVAIGSATQICIFLIPFMVVVGWMIGQPLSLYFHTFETAVVFASVIIVQFVTSEGKSTWLHGLILVVTYIIVGGAFYAHNDDLVAASASSNTTPTP